MRSRRCGGKHGRVKKLKERADPKNAALIVVDVQNDFVSPDGSAGKRGEDVSAALAIMPPLLRLIDAARRVGLTIVYIRTTHSEWTDTPSWIYRTSQKGGLSTCREGTWGAEFYDGIAPLPTERVVVKAPLQRLHQHRFKYRAQGAQYSECAGVRRGDQCVR